MTLTAALPSRRQPLPDPLHDAFWPSDSVPVLDDDVIGEVSLLQQARRLGMPLIHGDGVRAVAVGRVVARVEAFDDRVDLAVRVPDDLAFVWTEARLIGRISAAPSGGVRLSTPLRWQSARTALPHDVTVGDLVAIPFDRA